MRSLARLSLIAALILPVVACKGPTGVSGDKQLNELSEEEKKTACENIGEYTEEEIGDDRLLRFSCSFTAALTASEAECDLAFDACVAEGKIMSEQESCDVDRELVCEATVEEYEACLDEQIAATIELIDGFSCAAIFASEGEGGGALPEVGPLCTDLAQRCPGLFTAGTEG